MVCVLIPISTPYLSPLATPHSRLLTVRACWDASRGHYWTEVVERMKNAGPFSQNANLNDNTRQKKLHKHWWVPNYGLLIVKLNVLCVRIGFFRDIYCTESIYRVYKIKLENRSCKPIWINIYTMIQWNSLIYLYIYIYTIFLFGARAPRGPGPPHSRGF
jgi:hypothetical protein